MDINSSANTNNTNPANHNEKKENNQNNINRPPKQKKFNNFNKNNQNQNRNNTENTSGNGTGNGIVVKPQNYFGNSNNTNTPNPNPNNNNNFNKKNKKKRSNSQNPANTNTNQEVKENKDNKEINENKKEIKSGKPPFNPNKFNNQQNKNNPGQEKTFPAGKNKNKNKNKNSFKENREIKEEKRENIFESNDFPRDFNVDAEDIETEEVYVPITPLAEPVPTGPMVEIVGIRFKPVGKIYFFSPNEIEYSANEKIIVETSRGLELGYVVIPNKNISEDKVVQPLKPVLKKATDEDIERWNNNKITAKETIKLANERIKFHKLDEMKMKLVEAEYTFDNTKLIYYFTADGRVDFRELVKDLAAIFKTRIEMRQIGIRDQTKILGGLSICGRPFCCNSFLQDFAQVTIKMAKEQNMSINSAKISGACGRLMCCLKYEHEAYDYLNKETPKVNSIVEASTGETGVVIDSNILTGICKVRVNTKGNNDGDSAIKPFPKKSLKIIGFVKNEQKHLYDEKNNKSEKDDKNAKDEKAAEPVKED